MRRLPDYQYPVVLFGNAIGDHLLCLPALRALAALFPERLALACMPGALRTTFADVPLHSVCEIEMPGRGGSRVFDARALARKIGKCDLLLSLHTWHSASVDRLLEILAPVASVGFTDRFTACLPRSPGKHAADLAFCVPRQFDPALRLEDYARPPKFPVRCARYARSVRRLAGLSGRVLAIHTETKPEKTWPRARFVRLLRLFLARHPEFFIVVLDLKNWKIRDARVAERIVQNPGLPIRFALSLLGECDLFVGVDSCMLHAADLYRLPGVGLFGPTKPQRYGFRLSPHRHVCDPRGMNRIAVRTVLQALESVLP